MQTAPIPRAAIGSSALSGNRSTSTTRRLPARGRPPRPMTDPPRARREPDFQTPQHGNALRIRRACVGGGDGHTLQSAIEQVEILTATTLSIVLADRGYRGVKLAGDRTRLTPSHTRRLAPSLKRLLKRRQVVETMIGHMEADWLLVWSWLKGELGDALHAVMCGAGHNLRMIPARLRALYCLLSGVLVIRHREGQPYERGEAELMTAYC